MSGSRNGREGARQGAKITVTFLLKKRKRAGTA